MMSTAAVIGAGVLKVVISVLLDRWWVTRLTRVRDAGVVTRLTRVRDAGVVTRLTRVRAVGVVTGCPGHGDHSAEVP
ncbi:hypothetical protein GCM10010522_34420 [Kribbella solani]